MNADSGSSLAGLQYGGLAGVSRECQAAVLRHLQYGDRVTRARILSSTHDHCFLLTINTGELVAIKSGFTSGYAGEGPRTFSYVLRLLDAYDVEFEEYQVSQDLIDRLDQSALTEQDLAFLEAARPGRSNRVYDYILPDHWDCEDIGGLWREFPFAIPFAVIDSRITDLAITFWQRPDEKLMTGYRRLEDIVRARIGADEYGAKLFSVAFVGPTSKLRWTDVDGGEQTGRASLFTGTFMAYRNPRAHREPANRPDKQLTEFLLLNHLFVLERDAVDREAAEG